MFILTSQWRSHYKIFLLIFLCWRYWFYFHSIRFEVISNQRLHNFHILTCDFQSSMIFIMFLPKLRTAILCSGLWILCYLVAVTKYIWSNGWIIKDSLLFGGCFKTEQWPNKPFNHQGKCTEMHTANDNNFPLLKQYY